MSNTYCFPSGGTYTSLPSSWTPLDPVAALHATLPPLDLVVSGLPAGMVGAVVAPGGLGKTTLMQQLAVALATGAAPAGGLYPAAAPMRVALLAAEETDLVLAQRLQAAMRHAWGSALDDVLHRAELDALLRANLRLYGLCGEDTRLVRDRALTPVVDDLERIAQGARLLILDPLRSLHDGDENGSEAMSEVLHALGRVARRTGAAVLVVHHAGKAAVLSGQGDAQQAARGSSALTDGVRWQVNLAGMTEDQARRYGVPLAHRHRYVRHVVAKANYASSGIDTWLERSSTGMLARVDLEARTTRVRRTVAAEATHD